MGFSKGSTSSDSTNDKEKVIEPQHPNRSRDIKCFKCLQHRHIASKCLNKRVMVVHRKYRELVSRDESETKVEDDIE